MNTKKNNVLNLLGIKSFITIGLALAISVLPVYSQQIIPDGYTNTNLDINGNLTNVSTNTIKGANAFNSFSKFDVYQGNTVNLVVPNQSTNLINIIKYQATNIDGVLNSLKNNQIGGNIFLVNPHGIFVGKQGIINVGSLTAITPTKAFTDSFFDSPGNPNDNAINVLLNGKAPLNVDANVYVGGQIKAIDKVKIDTGTLTNSGTIQIADIVNLENIKNASTGEIIIQTAKDVINTGSIIADRSANINAGNIDIDANNNIQLASNSLVSAKGQGKNSNGGNINILAQNNALFEYGAILDVRGGDISGDGGFVELSANKAVQLSGEFKASTINGAGGSVLVDPPTLDILVNQFTNGANMTFQADNTLTVANGVILSSRQVASPTTVDHLTALSTGNSGSINLSSNNIILGTDSKLYAHANNGFTPGNVNLQGTNPNASIKLGGLVYTNGTLNYTSTGSISNGSFTNNNYNVGGIINMTATTGAIGSTDSFILVNLFDSNSGSINATAAGNICFKSTKDMRIGQLNSTGPADVYLTTNNGKIVDALNGTATNVTANNFFIQMLTDSQNFYFIGINGDAKAEKNSGLMNYYLNTLKNHGQNWLKMPDSNYKIFDDSIATFTENDILNAISNYANNLKSKDVLLIVYNGHGYGGDPNPQFGEPGLYNGYDGPPVDEAVAGSTALNGADEGLALNGLYVSDDEFANALKNSKGTVYYLSGQCYGGGMFGGTADLDKVANANGFSYYGITGNIEGKMAWGSPYTQYGQNFQFNANLFNAMLDTLTESNPTTTSMNFDATSAYDWHTVNLSRAYNANGNVYINEWYNAVNKEPSYYAYYQNYTYHYPYKYTNFTNMTATQLQNTPVLYQTWNQSAASIVDSVGTSSLPLRVNLAGNMQIAAQNLVNIAGNVGGTSQITSNAGAVTLTGNLTGNVTVNANNNVNVNQSTGNLSVDKITANNSNANVISAGNLLNASSTTSANVISKTAYLQSNTGTIGTALKSFDINTTGNLIALANGLINIQGLSGNLNIDTINNNGTGTVNLKSAGSILNGIQTANPNIYGRDINLDAVTAGSIGVYGCPLNIYSNYYTTGGKVTAMANSYIYLNQTSGDLYLNTVSNAGRNDVNIMSTGSIFDFNAGTLPNIYSRNLMINAKGGSLGTANNPLNIDTCFNNSSGKLTAFSNGLINLKETSGSLILGAVSNAGRNDVKIYSDSSIINGFADNSPNIYGKSINLTSEKGSIGTSTTPVNLYVNYATTGGTLTSNSLDLTNVTQANGNLYVNSAVSTGSKVSINSAGSILNGSGGQGNTNISGYDINLVTVYSGSIGLYGDPLGLVVNGGKLSAQAYGYININQPNGNMNIDLVSNAGRSEINLNAVTGNILNANTTSLPNIYCRGLSLNASAGTIGSTTNALNIDSNYNSSSGTVSALANGFIYLNEYSGNLNLNALSNAGRSDIQIVSAGSILDGTAGVLTNIYAKSVNLFSINGSVGNSTNSLNIYENYNTTGGTLSAYAYNGLINIAQKTGNLSIYKAQAGGNVSLTSAGNMLNTRTDTNANIQGANITMTSQTGALGTQANPHYVKSTTGLVNTIAQTWIYVNKI